MPVLIRASADISAQRQTVQMGDASYFVTLIWRERVAAWYLTIEAIDGTAILTGVRLEPQQPVMRFASPAQFPDGVIVTVQAGILGDVGTKGEVRLVPTIGGPGGGTVPAGAAFNVPGEDHYWVLIEDSVKPVGGSFSPARAVCSEYGALDAAAGAITGVITPKTLTGANITGVSNPAAATPGTDGERVVQEDLATDLLLAFYLTSELPDATADADAPTVTVP